MCQCVCVCVCVESSMCVCFKCETGCLCGWRDCFVCVYGEMGVWGERDSFAYVSVCIEMEEYFAGAKREYLRGSSSLFWRNCRDFLSNVFFGF